jgi:hypothetical protein
LLTEQAAYQDLASEVETIIAASRTRPALPSDPGDCIIELRQITQARTLMHLSQAYNIMAEAGLGDYAGQPPLPGWSDAEVARVTQRQGALSAHCRQLIPALATYYDPAYDGDQGRAPWLRAVFFSRIERIGLTLENHGNSQPLGHFSLGQTNCAQMFSIAATARNYMLRAPLSETRTAEAESYQQLMKGLYRGCEWSAPF